MENKIRIGMIGAGVHTTNMLYPSLESLDNIERVAVCDLKEERAQKAAKFYAFEKYYTDYRKMLERENLAGVIIGINAKVHPQVVIDSVERGVDVLVEKPAAIYVEDAIKIQEAAKKNKRIVMIDHQKRYSTAYSKAMNIVKSEEFGDIVMIEAKMHGRPYETLFNCLMEWQIHNIDIVRAFGGEVKNVHAVQNRLTKDRSAIAVLLEFENGIIGSLNWGTEGGFGTYCERVEIIGSKWRGVYVENVRKVVCYNGNEASIWEPDWQPIHRNFTHVLDGYVGIIKKFVECIERREEGRPNIYDEIKNLYVIHEIARQLRIPTDWRYTPSER